MQKPESPSPNAPGGSAPAAAPEARAHDPRQPDTGFRQFIDRAPDAVFVRRGNAIVHANEALLRLLGRKREEVLGQDPVTAFVHPAHRAAVLEHRVVSPDDTDLREHRWVSKDGELIDVEVVGVTAEFEGAPARICMCRDLRERRRMQARLLVAGHMASVGTLAAGVAHEINNPLASLIANLRLAAREQRERAGDPGELKELLADAQEAAERVRRIVDGLRTFTRSDDGRRERLELPRLLDAAVELVASELRGRARLVKDYQEVGRVEANEARLVQVVVNLLINAAQAIPEGRPEQNEVRIELRAGEPGRAVIAIRDTGVGIPPERLARVFDPFFTTRVAGEGPGLGLSICHNVIAGLGGEITVESRAGLGSTFRIVLPAR
jgi:two-component system, NtrC family, sensor kinase